MTLETAAEADESGASTGADAEQPPETRGSRPRRTPTPPVQNVVDPAVDPVGDQAVQVILADGDHTIHRIDRDRLNGRLREAIAVLGRPVSRVSVLVVDDVSMADMHRRHAGEDGPTDVLTFPSAPPGAAIEADIAVNADEAARQAIARGHTLDDELLLYALHGVLHCAGYDDHTPADYDLMHAEEDRILETIGVGATFTRTPGASDRGSKKRGTDS